MSKNQPCQNIEIKLLIQLFLLFSIVLSQSALGWWETKYDTVKTNWPNGNLKEYYTRAWLTGNERGLQPHGQYNSYYESGNLKETGKFEWDKRIGVWIKMYDSQFRMEEGHYIDDVRHGVYREWHANNTLKTLGHYNMGKKHGLWVLHKPETDLANPDLLIDSIYFCYNGEFLVALEKNNGWPINESKVYYNQNLDLWAEWERTNSLDWLKNYKWFDIGKKKNGEKDGKWERLNHRGEIIDIKYYKDG
ncbi:MAG: hypothetical protein ABIJ45_01600, partial [Candidatus Zixiibacteriota bacterium]